MALPVSSCSACVEKRGAELVQLGIRPDRWDRLVGLAGNPNVGKSTLFNRLTGLRQHTGNWPGKTVTRAEGVFAHEGQRWKVVDLPGAYSLRAGSADEEVARDFVVSGVADLTVVVVDAARLERNLNLVLQILEVTDHVVVFVNLVDEARRNGIAIDSRKLSAELGVPVVAGVARDGVGIDELLGVMRESAAARDTLARGIATPTEAKADGGAEAESRAADANRDHGRASLHLCAVEPERPGWDTPLESYDSLAGQTFGRARAIAAKAQVSGLKKAAFAFDRRLDRVLTSRIFGFPVMIALLAAVFWLTIAGANVPSSLLASLLIDSGHGWLKGLAAAVGTPWWLDGFLLDGVYLATAWVVSVMLPPMAIFFPLFTLLEDFGYLPRVAFNLDSVFRRAGAHGKQALTMCMGFGCNAAGVVATRIIDSPRERLIAIITNNFSLCNGRWPTQILIATIFVGALAPRALGGAVSAIAVVGVALLGIVLMLFTSWLLSRTLLRGEASSFSLELPPYRPPRILQTLYTSVIDRTLIVLWRAVIFAVPAGAVIWLISNLTAGDLTLAQWSVGRLDPVGALIGLNGVILLAYVVAIPANEIVIPTVLMLTVAVTPELAGEGAGAGVMFEADGANATARILDAGGWSMLTGVNLMLFSLLHNPCSTTIFTIYRETRSVRWTSVATLLPVAMGLLACFLVAQFWRLA